MDKLHHYRELKRNRDVKDTSLFNKMSMNDKKTHRIRLDFSNPKEHTGLLWYIPRNF